LLWAQSMGHLAQLVGIGLSPLSTFGPEPKQGKSPLLFPRGGLLVVPAGRRQPTGQGGAVELAQNLRSLLRTIGWRGAHRGGLPMVMKTTGKRWSSVVRTRGGRSGTSGQWAADDEGVGGGSSWYSGFGQNRIESGYRRWARAEEDNGGEQRLPTSLTSDSGCNRVPHEEEETVVLQVGSNGGGGGWWWRSPVNRDGGGNGVEYGARAKWGRGNLMATTKWRGRYLNAGCAVWI
jgi:hypothetical protein